MFMAKKLSCSLVAYWVLSDRVLLRKFKGRLIDINVIQVYAPTENVKDEDVTGDP